MFFRKKKDGSLWCVQDYQHLNSQTIKNAYPILLISSIVGGIHGNTLFLKIDIHWGYNSQWIKEGDEQKAAFTPSHGSFKPTLMFFRLCNSPASFQTMMNDIFTDLIAQGKVFIYLNNITITTSEDWGKHLKTLKEVLYWMQEHWLFTKTAKRNFLV